MRRAIPYQYGIDTVWIPGFVLWIRYRYTETETKTETETCATFFGNAGAVEPSHWAYEIERFLKARASWGTDVAKRKGCRST
jgi:hypothetical protein